VKIAFSCQKRKLLIVQNDKSDVDKIGKGWYIPVFDSNVWKNTAERLILYSFSGGAFSFCDKFIVCFNPGLFFCPSHNVISCRTVFNQQFF